MCGTRFGIKCLGLEGTFLFLFLDEGRFFGIVGLGLCGIAGGIVVLFAARFAHLALVVRDSLASVHGLTKDCHFVGCSFFRLLSKNVAFWLPSLLL